MDKQCTLRLVWYTRFATCAALCNCSNGRTSVARKQRYVGVTMVHKCIWISSSKKQAHSQAEAMKPVLQHKFRNLHVTLFSPQTCSDDIKWVGPQYFPQGHMSAKQQLRSACANAQADLSYCFALISQTSQLSLDERWANMQSCRKRCALVEISEILLVGFIFIKFLATPPKKGVNGRMRNAQIRMLHI